MIRKMMLLASMAAVAVAFAAPASAEAEPSNWTMGEATLEVEGMAVFTGQMRFTFGKGVAWIECNVQLTHTLEAKKAKGHVTKFSATGCTTGLGFVKCTVTKVDPVNLPWVADAEKSGAVRFIKISGISVNFTQTGALCPDKSPSVSGTANAYPDLFTSISSEEFNTGSGTLESSYEGTATLSGTLKIEGSEAKTYGIQ